MLRRTAMKSRQRKEWEAKRASRAEREPHPVARLERAGVYGPAVLVTAPKGEAAKPGKRTPTKAEREWLDAIVAYGCIACRIDGSGIVPPAVHHILRGGLRMGHLFTLPLCDPGHHQNGAASGKVSRHPWKARFERRYGSEDFLLARLRAEIARTK